MAPRRRGSDDGESALLEQKARRVGVFGVFRRHVYWKCVVSTLLVLLCIAYALFCHLRHFAYGGHVLFTYTHGPCAQGYNFIPIVFGLMLYVVYIMECWHYRTKLFKTKKMHVTEAQDYLNTLQTALPIVWWKSVCYHYVRRTRQVTRYRNGDAISATQVYYERVNSHTAGNVFLYDICGVKDISRRITGLERFPVTRVKLSKGFVFACLQAANEFEEQRTRFFHENEVRDDYMEVREGLDLCELDFHEELLVFNSSSGRLPWFLCPTVFWMFSALLLSWPLRLIADCQSAHLHYQVTKLFGTNYLSPSSINYTGPLTRTSTMDSRELEAALRRASFLVVPSYSEAMLMQPLNQHINSCGSGRYPGTGAIHVRTAPIESSNEHLILGNYGALGATSTGVGRPPVAPPPRSLPRGRNPIPPRSRSMNFPGRSSRRGEGAPAQSNAVRPPNSRVPPRSLSIAGISAAWHSSGLSPCEDEDRRPLLGRLRVPPDEPPPPYELALRMCAPLYERIRRSFSSRLNSLHSSSKDLKSLPGSSAS